MRDTQTGTNHFRGVTCSLHTSCVLLGCAGEVEQQDDWQGDETDDDCDGVHDSDGLIDSMRMGMPLLLAYFLGRMTRSREGSMFASTG
jgi:hypothetical protein